VKHRGEPLCFVRAGFQPGGKPRYEKRFRGFARDVPVFEWRRTGMLCAGGWLSAREECALLTVTGGENRGCEREIAAAKWRISF
jgi:hypothetical protein